MANTDIVLPGHVYATPDVAEALDIVRQNPGVFGTGGTPTQLLRMLEWFVAPPCVLVLQDSAHGALSSTHGCVCVGDEFQFHGSLSSRTCRRWSDICGTTSASSPAMSVSISITTRRTSIRRIRP